METPNKTCQVCRWWTVARKDYEHEGYCRRRSPIKVDDRNYAIFPITQDVDWCGDWDLKMDNLDKLKLKGLAELHENFKKIV